MKAVQLNSNKELNIVDVEIPDLKPNEVLVKVEASALNHRESVSYTHLTLPTTPYV